jgi:A/G-specific adenine glycosylase
VLESWKGLGYNRRALYLHQTATILSALHGGRIPRSRQELARLPGIGMATASAVLAFAFDTPVAFIETNIRRVFLHFYFLEQERVKDSEILPLVEKTLDRRNPREWYYALMDYGAMLGARDRNPNLRSAHYRRQSAFEGSVRQARGMVLAVLLRWPRATRAQIAKNTGKKGDLLDRALSQLVEEGFVKKRGTEYFIP